MIKLTGEDSKPVYIAPEHVTAVNRHETEKSFVNTIDGGFVVTESPEEVTCKILEYKLAMVRYAIEYEEVIRKDANSHFWEDTEGVAGFYRLSGLEVEPLSEKKSPATGTEEEQ